jgi:hypothetical protein
MADQHVRLRQDRGMAQCPGAVTIEPDFRRDEGKIFGFAFWASHNTPQPKKKWTKDASGAKLLE